LLHIFLSEATACAAADARDTKTAAKTKLGDTAEEFQAFVDADFGRIVPQGAILALVLTRYIESTKWAQAHFERQE